LKGRGEKHKKLQNLECGAKKQGDDHYVLILLVTGRPEGRESSSVHRVRHACAAVVGRANTVSKLREEGFRGG